MTRFYFVVKDATHILGKQAACRQMYSFDIDQINLLTPSGFFTYRQV
jgi:hypothetical protein